MPDHDIAASFELAPPSFSAVLGKRKNRPIANALTARIEAAKRRLKAGGVLVEIAWLRKTGAKDVRGRQAVSTTMIDAFIAQRPSLDRDRLDTDRSDDTVLIILDPLAITDAHFFKWGDHTYSVKKVEGVIQDDSGVRYASEITLIR